MNTETDLCESVEESILLGTPLAPFQQEHSASCAHCQGTMSMTKSIKSDLESVPKHPAHKPMWIRELHDRKARRRQRRGRVFAGAAVAAAALLLTLGLSQGVLDRDDSSTSTAVVAERLQPGPNSTHEAAGANRPGAVEPGDDAAKGVRFHLALTDVRGEDMAPSPWSVRLLEQRLEVAWPEARVRVQGQELVVEAPSMRSPTLGVDELSRLLAPPLGELSIAISSRGPMDEVCSYVETDEGAAADGIEVAQDRWTVPGSGEERGECYLKASGDGARVRLLEYVEELGDRFHTASAHRFAVGLESDSDESVWRTHYFRAVMPHIDAAMIESSTVYWNEQSARPELLLELDEVGTRALQRLTSENIGERLGLRVDGEVLLYATIATEISAGKVSVSLGGEKGASEERVEELAELLGAAPLSLRIQSFERLP